MQDFKKKSVEFHTSKSNSTNKFRSKIRDFFSNEHIIPLKPVSVYMVISIIWTVFSKRLLWLFDSNRILAVLFKDWFFIILSSCILYAVIKHLIKKMNDSGNILGDQYMEFAIINQELASSKEELKRQFTELKKSREALREIAERYELAVEGSNDVIWDWDIQADKLFFSDKFKTMLEYTEEDELDFSYKTLASLGHPDDTDHILKALEDYLSRKTSFFQCELRLKTKPGDYIWVLARGKAVWDNSGRPLRIAGSITNITENKKWDMKLFEKAFYDSLTELPNRTLFIDKLSKSLETACKKNNMVSLLALDLDNFRTINDTLGHQAGDQLLKNIGILLRKHVEKSDVIARLEGDEFVILQSDIKNIDEATNTAEKIIHSLQQPWIMDNKEFYITASIGICIYPYHGTDVHTLLKNADTAMYRAKSFGKNKYQLFNQQMNIDIMERLELESYLRHALKRNEFFLLYQPQIDTRTKLITGAEALIRWAHPIKGVISPMDFIPMAEETGLIVSIGEWVLKTACRQSREFQEAGLPPICIAINISAKQLQQSDFPDVVKRVLEETGLEPERLELEITETVAVADLDNTINILNKLKSMGIKISLDDFGTGYSSLNYLKRLPINTLKIDKSFIRDISLSANEEPIARSLISLAHSMRLSVIAEGIETQEQYEFIKRQKCDKVQGYLFSKPLPPEGFIKLFN